MSVHGSFSGQTALVTGGSRGIGLDIAGALLAGGARVAITGRNPDSLENAAKELDAGDRLLPIVADAGDLGGAAAVIDQVIAVFGSLDLLVNNAGVNQPPVSLTELDPQAALDLLRINTVAPLVYVQHAWRAWLAEHGGVVVNMASSAGLKASHLLPWYAVSKAGLVQLTRQLAVDLAPGVRVNAVAPDVVKTDFTEPFVNGNEDKISSEYPLKRLGVPADVTSAVLFLLSSQSSWITGEVLVLDGGRVHGAKKK
jgi:NAD(P)-dependent dehydrogenase (short-subunit alcohol dehydrogenase family)